MLKDNAGKMSLLLVVFALVCLVQANTSLAQFYTVSGRVTYSTTGLGVPRAQVHLKVYEGNYYFELSVFTDNLGNYRINTGCTDTCVGRTMNMWAYKMQGGIKMWSGSIPSWTCGAEDETKNVVVSPVVTINTDAKSAVHTIPHASRTCAKNFPVISHCGDIQATEPSVDVDAFPVFYDLVEYQGFDYGLSWPGMYSCAFTSCSDLAIGTIAWPGDGISHAWYTCQYEPVAITGWGWIYDSGFICITAHPSAGGPNIGDCQGELGQPICNFCAGIGGYIGDDPCEPTATEPSSWGGIKAMFK
jgi:hypothetical protein